MNRIGAAVEVDRGASAEAVLAHLTSFSCGTVPAYLYADLAELTHRGAADSLPCTRSG
jgi:hypothetical protein